MKKERKRDKERGRDAGSQRAIRWESVKTVKTNTRHVQRRVSTGKSSKEPKRYRERKREKRVGKVK